MDLLTNGNGNYQIHALYNGGNNYHFVNDIGNGQYRDTRTGDTDNVNNRTRQTGGLGPTRDLDFTNQR